MIVHPDSLCMAPFLLSIYMIPPHRFLCTSKTFPCIIYALCIICISPGMDCCMCLCLIDVWNKKKAGGDKLKKEYEIDHRRKSPPVYTHFHSTHLLFFLFFVFFSLGYVRAHFSSDRECLGIFKQMWVIPHRPMCLSRVALFLTSLCKKGIFRRLSTDTTFAYNRKCVSDPSAYNVYNFWWVGISFVP